MPGLDRVRKTSTGHLTPERGMLGIGYGGRNQRPQGLGWGTTAIIVELSATTDRTVTAMKPRSALWNLTSLRKVFSALDENPRASRAIDLL